MYTRIPIQVVFVFSQKLSFDDDEIKSLLLLLLIAVVIYQSKDLATLLSLWLSPRRATITIDNDDESFSDDRQ